MTIFETYGKEITALFVPVLTWILNVIFKSKAKIHVALPHQFTFLIQQPLLDNTGTVISPTQTVKTNSFIIRNAGRESATKIEIVFNWEPMCLNVWPARHYEHHTEPDNRYVLIFDSLAPDETLGIEILSVNKDLPILIVVRCQECTSQNINMYPQPVMSNTTQIVRTTLMALGLGLTVYLLILLIQFLVLRTPLGN